MTFQPSTSGLCVCRNPECQVTSGECHCGCGKVTPVISGTTRLFVVGHGNTNTPSTQILRRFMGSVSVKTYYAKNRESLLSKQKERYAERKEAILSRQRERRGLDPLQTIISQSRSRASREGVEHTITREDVFIPTHCPVLGIELSFGHKRNHGGSPSLDRIVPSLGYVKGNVVVVSWRANKLKSDATIDELLAIARFYSGLVRT